MRQFGVWIFPHDFALFLIISQGDFNKYRRLAVDSDGLTRLQMVFFDHFSKVPQG